MIHEWKTGNYLEDSGHDLIEALFQILSRGIEEYYERSQSGKRVARPKIELSMPQIQVIRVMASSSCSSPRTKNKGIETELGQSWAAPAGGFSGSMTTLKKKLHGLSPRANYTDRATAACRRSNCQLVRIEGATWSA
jgi:hypothetical protein